MSKMEEQAIELKEQYEKALKNFNELKAAGQDVSFLYAETNKRYKEILKLDALLTEEKVNHILGRFIDGWIVIVYTPDGENRLCDAVEHFGSYGQEEDKLEIMGALTESELKDGPVLGCLTAKKCAKRFAYCYRKGSSVYSESDERLAQDFKELAECMRAKHEGIADDFQRISDNLNEGVKGKP